MKSYHLLLLTLLILSTVGCSDSADSEYVEERVDVAPQFVSAEKVTVSENQNRVITVTVDNAERLSYSVVSGSDAEKFEIERDTGDLRFVTAPDYESPTDANHDNIYNVTVSADTGTLTLQQQIQVTVEDIPETDTTLPLFTSSNTIALNENQTDVTMVIAEDSSLIRYSIKEGDDALLFEIDAISGVLRFGVAPDYELPRDTDGDNVYRVTVQATDSYFNTSSQTLTVTILDVDDTPPSFLSAQQVSVEENQRYVMTVYAYDSSSVRYTIVTDADSPLFSIDSVSGELQFVIAPDYEVPTDLDRDNIYKIGVKAIDAFDNSVEVLVEISVLDLDDTAPQFTSLESVRVNENIRYVTTVAASDENSVIYTLKAGLDSGAFELDSSSGLLSFKAAPDYESPTDGDSDNIYTLRIIATDSLNNSSEQELFVTVVDIPLEYPTDLDGDYIPDDIERYLGGDAEVGDQDSDGVLDGLQTDGAWGDPFFTKQWHLDSLGSYTNESGVLSIVGNDLDILELYHQYMGYNGGNNIIVQVIDTGVDADHDDLIANMDLGRSYDGETVGDPSPNLTTEGYTHGTMVAGIIGASAFNAKGVRGIVPFAKIAGSNWLETQSYLGLEKAWLSGVGANEIAISNNSWGSTYSYGTTEEDIMAIGTRDLRDGKGRIYLFAAGNERELNADANLQYSLSNRYAIAVAALKHDMSYASYSTPGANILVSGFGGDYYQNSPTIGTTTVMGTSVNSGDINTQTTWSADSSEDYTFVMNGTSSASPTVAGSVALVLEACPDLTWRDVRYLIAKHAKKNDPDNTLWSENSAGFSHNRNYGFGLINPKGMIDDCSASSYTNLPSEVSTERLITLNSAIADDKVWYSVAVDIADALSIEWVEVTVANNSTWASDYDIYLLSPSGTRVDLILSNNGASSDWSSSWMDGGFRFGTPAFMDENAQGTWRLYIRDNYTGDTGTLQTVQLKVYGH